MLAAWRHVFCSRVTDRRNDASTRSGTRTRPVTKRGCRTVVRVAKIDFTWTINNFSFCQEKTGEALRSPEFSENGGPKWILLIYPQGLNTEWSDYVGLFIQLNSHATMKVNYSLSLLRGGKRVASRSGSEQIFDWRHITWGFPKFVKKKVLSNAKNGSSPDADNLTIICEITASLGLGVHITDDSFNKAVITPFPVPMCTLSDDLEQLLDCHPELSDVVLETADGEEILAHKAILVARSRVFAAMFRHEMEERKSNRVRITDVEPAVLRAMLRYIYTSMRPVELPEMAEGLLVAADKYDLGRLKGFCEEVLVAKISTERVADILILADLYNAEQLKQEAISFVTRPDQSSYLFKTASWKNMVSKYPHLVNEALRTAIVKP